MVCGGGGKLKSDKTSRGILQRNERNTISRFARLRRVANALRYHPGFTAADVQTCIQSLFDMQIEIVAPTGFLLKRAIEIGMTEGVTCYDAIYLALAEDIAEEFITADEKLYRKLSSKRKKEVRLLKEVIL